MKKITTFRLFAIVAFCSCFLLSFAQNQKTFVYEGKDSLSLYYDKMAASAPPYYSRHQKYLDSLLVLNPNNAEAWRAKARPCFKTGKYEIGMKYLDKAVAIDEKEYINYRGFIKVIFTKQHSEAIADFKRAKILLGEQYTMDHPNNFWISLCYLQMNQLDSAKIYMERCSKWEHELKGEGKEHPLNNFYMGIIAYENRETEEAIRIFDKLLEWYERFSDVKYYKAHCFWRLGRDIEAQAIHKSAMEDLKAGYSIVEDNVIYELYPYQIHKYLLDH